MRRVEVHGPLTIDVRSERERSVPSWVFVGLLVGFLVVLGALLLSVAAGCGSVWIDLTPDGEDGEDLDAGEDLAPEEGDAGDGEQLVDVEDLADGEDVEDLDAGGDLAPEDLDAEDLAAEDLDAGEEVCGAWWFADVDGDGFGAGVPLWVECGLPDPPGYVTNVDDCCDEDPDAYPGQVVCFVGRMPACDPPGVYDCDWNCDGERTNCDPDAGGGCR
jgi:hypothetical protein